LTVKNDVKTDKISFSTKDTSNTQKKLPVNWSPINSKKEQFSCLKKTINSQKTNPYRRVSIAKNNVPFLHLAEEDEKEVKCAKVKCEKSAEDACSRLLATLAMLYILMKPKKDLQRLLVNQKRAQSKDYCLPKNRVSLPSLYMCRKRGKPLPYGHKQNQTIFSGRSL
jgi:hypothetical protein